MRRIRRTAWLAPASLALVLVLGACGDDAATTDRPAATVAEDRSPGGDSSAPTGTGVPVEIEVVDAAVAATESAGTARIEGEIVPSGTGLPEEPITVSGEVDLTTGNGTITTDLGGLGLPGGTDFEARVVDGVVYVQLGALLGDLAGELPGAGSQLGSVEWLRIDPSRLGASTVGPAGDPFSFSSNLQYLRGVTGGVEELGEEQIGGVTTTHYRAEVDPKAVADALPDEVPAEARDAVEQSLEDIEGTFDVEFWVDADDRIRRQQFEVGVEVDGQTFTQRVRLDLSDFGVPVEVEAPPEDATADFGSLLEDLLGPSASLPGATTAPQV